MYGVLWTMKTPQKLFNKFTKITPGTIHKVCTLKFGDFQTPPPPFYTIEWRHKNNRCTLLPWPSRSPLERTYFMDGPQGVLKKQASSSRKSVKNEEAGFNL